MEAVSQTNGQLRSLTVLVCDMVGSTDMRVRLGADGERLFHLNEQLCREAVAAHHGTWIKSLGDGAMAIFDAAADAISAAVLVQRQIATLHRRGEALELNVRTGISAGDVLVAKDDCHGVPVAEAVRVCAAAEAGEILVADIVKALARRTTVALSPAGDLVLKGLDEPVTTWRVEWQEHHEDWSAVPVPNRVVARPDTVFIGRDHELEAVLASARDALKGQAREFVLLAGEPGVGKSALAREAANALRSETGAVVVHGGCDDDLRPPYQPFVQALRHLVRHAPTTALVDYVGRYGGDLGVLVPELADRLGRLPAPRTTDEAADRYLLFAAVGGLLEVALRDVPLILLLDDLHWADRGTTLLLRHLLVATELTGLVIIGTLRNTEQADDNGLTDLIAELRRVEGFRRIDLEGLPGDEMRELVATMLRGASQAIAAIADAVHSETNGNAFFATELIRHVQETGDVEGSLTELPVSVRDVVRQRIRRMGPDTVSVLSSAAVIGAEFDWKLLDRLVDLPRDTVLDVLERAVASAVIREVPGRAAYHFVHALMQHTLYDDLSETRRRRLHLAAAEAIDEVGDAGPAASAAHWLAAGDLADPHRVRTACVRAADEACAQRAPDEAVRWFAAALDHPGIDESTRCTLLVHLGDAQRMAGDFAHHQTLLAAGALAMKIGDVDSLCAAALANTRWFSSSVGSGDPDERKLLEAALDTIGPEPSSTRARLLATLTGELVYSDRPETRYDAADEALEVARIVGDDLTTFDVLFWRSTSARPLDGSWRDDELAELLAIAERGSDPLRTAMADMVTVMRGLHVGDIAGAEQALAATADLADQLRLPLLRWLVTIVRATCVTLGGRLDDGEKLVQEAFELSQATDQPDALAWYGVQLYMVRFQQARLAEMIPLLAGASSSTPTLLTWHAALALAYAEVDQLDAAERVTSMLIEAGYPQRPQEPHWVIGMSCLGSALAAIGRDAKGMQAAYDALLPRARIWASIMPLSLGSNERVLGELALALGRTEDAVGHFERAVRSNDAGPSPTFAALARVGLIQALRKSGDAERAATIADEVSAAVDRHGLARVADRLEAALAGDPAT